MSVFGEIQKRYDDAGPLTAISESRFDGDRSFITAYGLASGDLTVNLFADGVRFEFGAPSEPVIIELVVVGSQFDLFVPTPSPQVSA